MDEFVYFDTWKDRIRCFRSTTQGTPHLETFIQEVFDDCGTEIADKRATVK